MLLLHSIWAAKPFLINNLINTLFTWLIKEGPDLADAVVMEYLIEKHLCCLLN